MEALEQVKALEREALTIPNILGIRCSIDMFGCIKHLMDDAKDEYTRMLLFRSDLPLDEVVQLLEAQDKPSDRVFAPSTPITIDYSTEVSHGKILADTPNGPILLRWRPHGKYE